MGGCKFEFNGKTLNLSTPAIMGILNVTPDSFYDGGKFNSEDNALRQVEKMIADGATIIDVGALSTRPFSEFVSEDDEWERLEKPLKNLRKAFPEMIISVDTFRSEIARKAVDSGADMINDISGGQLDDMMFEKVVNLGVCYVMMHMKGTPQDMQVNPTYEDVTAEVLGYFAKNLEKMKANGNTPLIIDPGFGFGKTVEHNYRLLNDLPRIKALGYPVLAGVSRKSMINKVLGTSPEDALNGTTVLNTICLLQGADILRVHDVAEALEAIKLVKAFQGKTDL